VLNATGKLTEPHMFMRRAATIQFHFACCSSTALSAGILDVNDDQLHHNEVAPTSYWYSALAWLHSSL